MNIQQVCRETGLGKKAVYFYINEGIITPERDEKNGYFIFTDEHLQKLKAVRILRELDVPVMHIKKLLTNPSLTPYYLHHHLDTQKKQLKKQLENTQRLQGLIDELPPNVDYNVLGQLIDKACVIKIDSEWERLSLSLPEREAGLVAILIWRFFMQVSATEYRTYLWNKIIAETDRQMSDSLLYLRWYLRLVQPQDIEAEAAQAHQKAQRIANMSSEDTETVVQEILECCRRLAQDENLQEYWKVEYEKIILPLIEFTSGQIGKLIGEYNPSYIPYSNNMHECCMKARDLLLNGVERPLYDELQLKLNGKMEIENKNGTLLGFLYTFENSLYTKLELKLLRQLLNDVNRMSE